MSIELKLVSRPPIPMQTGEKSLHWIEVANVGDSSFAGLMSIGDCTGYSAALTRQYVSLGPGESEIFSINVAATDGGEGKITVRVEGEDGESS